MSSESALLNPIFWIRPFEWLPDARSTHQRFAWNSLQIYLRELSSTPPSVDVFWKQFFSKYRPTDGGRRTRGFVDNAAYKLTLLCVRSAVEHLRARRSFTHWPLTSTAVVDGQRFLWAFSRTTDREQSRRRGETEVSWGSSSHIWPIDKARLPPTAVRRVRRSTTSVSSVNKSHRHLSAQHDFAGCRLQMRLS